jgi:hypothetical protein
LLRKIATFAVAVAITMGSTYAAYATTTGGNTTQNSSYYQYGCPKYPYKTYYGGGQCYWNGKYWCYWDGKKWCYWGGKGWRW